MRLAEILETSTQKGIKEKKRMISSRGYVPMLVGRGDKIERFLVHTKLLNHPLIKASLELRRLLKSMALSNKVFFKFLV